MYLSAGHFLRLFVLKVEHYNTRIDKKLLFCGGYLLSNDTVKGDFQNGPLSTPSLPVTNAAPSQ
jgi:hypothetical protein